MTENSVSEVEHKDTPQQYTVHFTSALSISVTVEATDPQDAIERAFDEAPAGICAQCSGWGQRWSKDDDGELEPVDVSDADGNRVWPAADETGGQR